MTKTYVLYEVHADAATGEWFGEPETIGEVVDTKQWALMMMTDTEQYHCDTYETGDGETRALKVWWIPESEQ